MDPLTIGILSVGAIVVLVYLGLYIPVALGLVSFVSIWMMSGADAQPRAALWWRLGAPFGRRCLCVHGPDRLDGLAGIHRGL